MSVEQIKQIVERRQRRDTRERMQRTIDAQSVTDRTRFNVAGSLLSRVPGEVGKNRSRTPTRLEAKRPTTTMTMTTRHCVHPLTKRDRPRLPRHVYSGNRTTFLSHVRASCFFIPGILPGEAGVHPTSERYPAESFAEEREANEITFLLSRLS